MVTKNKLKAFTIVELLIVIVIIGILAAITVVSFTGITAKANTASEQSAANAVISKALVYKASTGNYPLKLGTLTALASSDPANLTGVTSAPSLAAAPASPYNSVKYQLCGTKSGNLAITSYATDVSTDSGVTQVSTTTLTGIIATFWNFNTGALDNSIYDGNITTSASVGCVAAV